jgi:hypothetical protein
VIPRAPLLSDCIRSIALLHRFLFFGSLSPSFSMASASATPTSIPGAHAPLAHISSKDQGGLVAVLAALAWTFVFTAFTIRVYVRYKTGPWKRDDNCLAVATVCD